MQAAGLLQLDMNEPAFYMRMLAVPSPDEQRALAALLASRLQQIEQLQRHKLDAIAALLWQLSTEGGGGGGGGGSRGAVQGGVVWLCARRGAADIHVGRWGALSLPSYLPSHTHPAIPPFMEMPMPCRTQNTAIDPAALPLCLPAVSVSLTVPSPHSRCVRSGPCHRCGSYADHAVLLSFFLSFFSLFLFSLLSDGGGWGRASVHFGFGAHTRGGSSATRGV